MKVSPASEVRALYEDSAESYSKMMDSEIGLPIYADTLGRLADRIADLPGPVIDTSCGSGHMLARYHEVYDSARALLGIDLSPRMVAITKDRLGSHAEALTGDMRDLEAVEPDSASAVLSFFAIHHVDPGDVLTALREWHRVLRRGGQLVLAAWEGTGPLDYGSHSDLVALRYTEGEVVAWAREAGFAVDRCVVEPVEEMPMKAIYLESTKP